MIKHGAPVCMQCERPLTASEIERQVNSCDACAKDESEEFKRWLALHKGTFIGTAAVVCSVLSVAAVVGSLVWGYLQGGWAEVWKILGQT
jgi:hypothetical protein